LALRALWRQVLVKELLEGYLLADLLPKPLHSNHTPPLH
jgi:hypothetical protein